MHPNYVGNALRTLSGDVRDFVEAPSRNAYRQSMAELENAKFNAQKPMIELQTAEAREQLAPVTVDDIGMRDAPPHIQAVQFSENNIDGLPSNIHRYARAMGADELRGKVFYRNGKPVPRYVLKSETYLRRSRPIRHGSIDPVRHIESELAMLNDKKAAGEKFTPDEQAKYQKYTNMGDADFVRAYNNKVNYLRDESRKALDAGDLEFADWLMKEAQFAIGQRDEYQNRVNAASDFQKQKELMAYEASLRNKDAVTAKKPTTWMNPNNPKEIVNLPLGEMPPDGWVEYQPPTDGGSPGAMAQKVDLFMRSYGVDQATATNMVRKDDQLNGRLTAAAAAIKAREMEILRESQADPGAAQRIINEIHKQYGVSKEDLLSPPDNSGVSITDTSTGEVVIPKRNVNETIDEYLSRISQ